MYGLFFWKVDPTLIDLNLIISPPPKPVGDFFFTPLTYQIYHVQIDHPQFISCHCEGLCRIHLRSTDPYQENLCYIVRIIRVPPGNVMS